MNSEKRKENKGNLCVSAFPKFWEAGFNGFIKLKIFLEARMDRPWKEGSHVVKADQDTSLTSALRLRRLYLNV